MLETIYDHLKAAADRYPERVALLHKQHGEYVGMSYQDLLREVDSVAANLSQLGLRKGDAVGIFSGNRPEWAIADLAAMKLGCVVVPLHPAAPAPHISYAAIDSRIKILFVENEHLLKTIQSLPGYLSPFKLIVLFDDSVPQGAGQIIKFGHLRIPRPRQADFPADISGNDVATIVYTSGTTGEPKGVVLTHRNIVSNAVAVQQRFQVDAADLVLSYLPLSHMFERTCGYYTMLFAGAAIAYAEHAGTVAEDVRKIRPTILLAVPSVIEKAYHRVVGEVNRSSLLRRIIVSLAIKVMNLQANRNHKGRRIPYWMRATGFLSNRYVAFAFRQLAGGRLRIVASGGAPLDRKIAKLYHILGFTIVEGYGLTETSPIVTCHTLNDRELGTVGKPLDGIEVKIGSNYEVLVRGPNVMQGYLNRPEDTARAIDPDGWFHTGDQGRFDARNNLIITGRIKDLIVLSNGEKLATAAMEAKIVRSQYISQAVLFGDRRKFVVALLVPNREQVELFARSSRLHFADYTELLHTPEVHVLIAGQVELSGRDMLPYERVRAFSLLPEPFTIENDLLTHTLKVRRGKIEEQYHDVIDNLYRTAPPVNPARALASGHEAGR